MPENEPNPVRPGEPLQTMPRGESALADHRHIVLKFKDSLALPAYQDNVELLFEGNELRQLWSEITRLAPGATFRRVYRTLRPEQIDRLSERAFGMKRDYKAPNFLKNYILALPPGSPVRPVLDVLRGREDVVERCYRAPQVVDPGVTGVNRPESQFQWYLGPAPLGIDARHAWLHNGGDGKDQAFIDIEQGWTLDHADLLDANGVQRATLLAGLPSAASANHGTSVLGVVCATDNAFGCVGIAPNTPSIAVISHGGHAFNIPEAIKIAANTLTAGGIILLEASLRLREGTLLLPVEIDPLTFEEIQHAVALGLVVIEAAGNSNFPLESYKDQLRNASGGKVLHRDDANGEFLDSGAIMVGSGWRPDELAAAPTPWSRRADSNYGSRIDCFGWGDSVQTIGSTPSNPRDAYDSNFSGTSSAAAIVAGAALCLQGMAQAQSGARLDPETVRTYLSDPNINTRTIQSPLPGTPPEQLPVDQVGVMPDLARIARVRLGLAPPSP